MRISVFKGTSPQSTKYVDQVVEVASFQELAGLISTQAWAPGTFKEGRRTNATLESIDSLVLDIDEGLTIAEAKERLDSLQLSYLLMPSKSHQKQKGKKPPCDRFRLVLPLSEPISTDADFKATWAKAKELFSEADDACKDAARFYYPCLDEGGSMQLAHDFPVTRYVPPEPKAPGAAAPLAEGARGELSRATLKFLAKGAEPGSWHRAFFKAATDLKEQLYTFDEAAEMLKKASPVGELDEEHDFKTLRDVFSKPPKYEPRTIEQPQSPTAGGQLSGGQDAAPPPSKLVSASSYVTDMLSYLKDKDKVKGTPTLIDGLDKLLGGGKRFGEVTVTHAHAKTGKNTLWHAMLYRWLESGIPNAYASRELSPDSEVLPNLLSLKIAKNAWLEKVDESAECKYKDIIGAWPLFFAEGYGVLPYADLERWVEDGYAAGVRFFWVDHLHYCLDDPEDHKLASKFIKQLKALAKRLNVHIDLIVQPNYLQVGQRLSLNSIKGGAAIGQALDNLILLERVPDSQNVVKVTLEVARSKLASCGEIYLQYDKTTTDFTEVEKQKEPQHESEAPRGVGSVSYSSGLPTKPPLL